MVHGFGVVNKLRNQNSHGLGFGGFKSLLSTRRRSGSSDFWRPRTMRSWSGLKFPSSPRYGFGNWNFDKIKGSMVGIWVLGCNNKAFAFMHGLGTKVIKKIVYGGIWRFNDILLKVWIWEFKVIRSTAYGNLEKAKIA